MANQTKVTALNPLAELLTATARGDRQAFRQVYQLSSPRLFAVTLRILRRRELAEEVMQDAFITIWRKAGQYHPERGAPLAWMTRIVRNRAIDRLRAEGRAPAEVANLDQVAEVRSNGGGQEPHFVAHASETLRDCLGLLKDDQRNSIVLAYYYGLTHEELASQLEAPLGTVKSWVRRGLLQLKDCIDQ